MGVARGVVLLLVELPGLFELGQFAVQHVGGGRHRRLGREQRGDGRPLLRLLLRASAPLLRTEERKVRGGLDAGWTEVGEQPFLTLEVFSRPCLWRRIFSLS